MAVMIKLEENGVTKVLAIISMIELESYPCPSFVCKLNLEDFTGGNLKACTLPPYPKQELDVQNPIIIEPPSKGKLTPSRLVPREVKAKRGPRVYPSGISYVSSKGIECGIATYSSFLANAVSQHFPAQVYSKLEEADPKSLIHAQVEFGVFRRASDLLNPKFAGNYKVATWHTVFKAPHEYHLEYVRAIDEEYDAHIAHNILAKRWLTQYVSRPVYLVPHGCIVFDPIEKAEARKRLGLPLEAKIGFCFGFAADSKGFAEVLDVAAKVRRKRPFMVVVSGAKHAVLTEHSEKVLRELTKHYEGGIVLGKYLSEDEINLYASASDMLIFNYKTPSTISSASGAMSRVIASGKPVVCSCDTRLTELEDGHHCLKFSQGDLTDLQSCIELVLDDMELAEKLGENVRRLALNLSWQNIALKHLKVYEDVVGEPLTEKLREIPTQFTSEYYDRNYFADPVGKSFRRLNGSINHWGYRNPFGEFLGGGSIAKAWKAIFQPMNMLDCGCGRGTFIPYCRDEGIEAEGFDFSEWAIQNPYPRCKKEWLKLHDATQPWPYPESSFDLVTALDFLEHIYAEDLDFVIREMHRVARKWVFLQTAVAGSGSGYILKKGQPIPPELEGCAVAGHVTVQPESFWYEKLRHHRWVSRQDLVKKFCSSVDPAIIRNWLLNSIIVMEKLE